MHHHSFSRCLHAQTKQPGPRVWQHTRKRVLGRRCSTFPQAHSSDVQDTDVVVVGAGIIGLCIAHQLLESTKLHVVMIDRKQPCAGATGAGQGYVWCAHRQPGTPGWDLALRSKRLWEAMAANPALAQAMEWQANGSLLLATTPNEVEQLTSRAAMLSQHGIAGVRLLDDTQLQQEETALVVPQDSAGLLVASDAQINGKATAFTLLHECERMGSGGRFTALWNEQVAELSPGTASTGVIAHTYTKATAPFVVTARRRLRARHAVIVAAGVWSGTLLSNMTRQDGWGSLLQPRRGHLLELQQTQTLPVLRHGVMELSYTQHYSHGGSSSSSSTGAEVAGAPGPSVALDLSTSRAASIGSDVGSSDTNKPLAQQSGMCREVDITFTATTSASGSLLLGSSREFDGWSSSPKEDIIHAILDRARLFVPAIPSGADVRAHVRVGLRPFAVGGLPAVGPVEQAPGVFVAAGHEGSGLCMGPATAELVLHHALGLSSHQLDGAGSTMYNELLPSARLAAVEHHAVPS